MANKIFLNLVSEAGRLIKGNRGVQETPLPEIGDRDTIHLLRTILMCDEMNPHPIHNLIYHYIQDDMRKVYTLAESIIRRLYKYIGECPIDLLSDQDDIVRDLAIFEDRIHNVDHIFMIKCGVASWYVSKKDIDFMINYTQIYDDLDQIEKDIQRRITYLNLIFIHLTIEMENLKYKMSGSTYKTCMYYASYIEGYCTIFNGLILVITSMRKSIEYLHGKLTGIIKNS